MSRKCLLDCSANGAKWADDVQARLSQELVLILPSSRQRARLPRTFFCQGFPKNNSFA